MKCLEGEGTCDITTNQYQWKLYVPLGCSLLLSNAKFQNCHRNFILDMHVTSRYDIKCLGVSLPARTVSSRCIDTCQYTKYTHECIATIRYGTFPANIQSTMLITGNLRSAPEPGLMIPGSFWESNDYKNTGLHRLAPSSSSSLRGELKNFAGPISLLTSV